MTDLKTMLAEQLLTEVSLLDAHSFAWMLAAQMDGENKLANTDEYLALSSTERDAIVKARIGQGRFRDSLVAYWSKCAVTGCRHTKLLVASHIKPWKHSNVTERLSLFNGLLLSPALDACFDSGLVTFDETGRILISSQLSAHDAQALSLHSQMRLCRIDAQHNDFLTYHREHIFLK